VTAHSAGLARMRGRCPTKSMMGSEKTAAGNGYKMEPSPSIVMESAGFRESGGLLWWSLPNNKVHGAWLHRRSSRAPPPGLPVAPLLAQRMCPRRSRRRHASQRSSLTFAVAHCS
jgi:hypothetical protein